MQATSFRVEARLKLNRHILLPFPFNQNKLAIQVALACLFVCSSSVSSWSTSKEVWIVGGWVVTKACNAAALSCQRNFVRYKNFFLRPQDFCMLENVPTFNHRQPAKAIMSSSTLKAEHRTTAGIVAETWRSTKEPDRLTDRQTCREDSLTDRQSSGRMPLHLNRASTISVTRHGLARRIFIWFL